MLLPDIDCIEPYDVRARFEANTKAVIVGDRCTGKTTLLRHILSTLHASVENVFSYDEAESVPLLRDTPCVAVATVSTHTYWDVDTQLDPDVVFVFPPKSEESAPALRAVFVSIVSKAYLDLLFSQLRPYECLVLDFRVRGDVDHSCVFKLAVSL